MAHDGNASHGDDLAWKCHDLASDSDYYGFSDPVLHSDASAPVEVHFDEDPELGQLHSLLSQSTTNHETIDFSSSIPLSLADEGESDFKCFFGEKEDGDDFEEDHDAVNLSLFQPTDNSLLLNQQDANDLLFPPAERSSAGSSCLYYEGSDPFDEFGESCSSILGVEQVPDITDDAEIAESLLDLDLIVSQATAESASLTHCRPHRVIIIGDPASAWLTQGSPWKTQQRSRQWLSFRIGAGLDAITEAWRDGALPVLRMLSRSPKAWICDEGSHTMRLRSTRWAHKSVRGETLRFDVYCQILRYAKDLLDSNQTATKRDIYYRDVSLFKCQASVDTAVEDLACAFGVPRFCLRIVASAKGLVYGNLIITLKDGSRLDCSQGSDGMLIPPTEQIAGVQTEARFILVIEKDATFRTLLDHGFADKQGPCVLVTGKGYPDVATRQLVRRLSEMKLSAPPCLFYDSSGSAPSESQPSEFVWDDGEGVLHWDLHEHPAASVFSSSCSPFFESRSEPALLTDAQDPGMLDQEDLEFDLSTGSSLMQSSADDPGQLHELSHTDNDGSSSSNQSAGNNGLNIPALALVDCDPHGVEIFLCYKAGSESMAFDRGALACNSLRWLGIRPTDWTTKIAAGVNGGNLLDSPALLPLTSHDRRKIINMLTRRPALRTLPDVKRQLSRMLRYNRKSEIQALDANLLAQHYLPRRIGEELGRGEANSDHVE
ncbi:endodeoxyribonuclease [Geranomyces michiganensis]|nr:endodeoxyribonuclease [Geranomyces michiganensis]